MRKTNFIKVFLLSFIFSSILSINAFADVNIAGLQGLLNGKITQQQINQSNKPQFSDRSDSNEIIDPITGALTLKQNDITLPGKDGLDFSIGRIYNSVQAEYGTKKVKVESTSSSWTNTTQAWYVDVFICNKTNGTWTTQTDGPYTYKSDADNRHDYYLTLNPNNYYTYIPNPPYYNTLTTYYTNYTITTTNYPDKYNYQRAKYDLGEGWELAFPSVQIETEQGTDYTYFHDGNGGVYSVSFTADTTDSNLENYQGKDVLFDTDSGTFSFDGATSAYKFVASDKRTYYFAQEQISGKKVTKLIGIVDRFGNQIKFKYIYRTINGISYPYIAQIIDTVGRTVDFVYQNTINDTTFNGENITVTVHDPNDSSRTLSFTYVKLRQAFNYYLNGQLVESFYEPYLYQVIDPAGISIWYQYNIPDGIRFRYDTKDLSINAGSTVAFLLSLVQYPCTTTNYEYEKIQRNLGPNGATDAYRIKTRYDKEWRWNNGSWTSSDDIKHVNYTYGNDYTGYPTYLSDESIPESYQIWSKETIASNSLATKNTFNGKKQLISQETTASNGEKKIIKNNAFDTTFIQKPTQTEADQYATDGTLAKQLYVYQSYYNWGGLQTTTKPLTSAQANDTNIKAKYTTTYEYDPNYKFITKQQWHQNDNTLLSENYTYNTSGRLSTYTNAKGETTNYNYSNVAEGYKVETTKTLENGKTSKTAIIYGNETSKAYPTAISNYYTNDQNVYTETKVTRTYDMLHGLVKTEADNLGKTTTYTYDNLGRPTLIKKPNFTNADGQTYQVEEKYEYANNYYLSDSITVDENKNLRTTRVYAYVNYKDPANNVSCYNESKTYYDGYGNPRIQYVWESARNAWITTQYSYDNLARPVYSVDQENNKTNYAYDAWGSQNETIDALGNLQRTEYDTKNSKVTGYFVAQANVASFRSNPANSYKENVLEVTFDQWDRPIERKAYPNWPDASGAISETYAYDFIDNLVSYTDPKRNLNEDGITKKYSYDQLDRLTVLKDALNQTAEISYNLLGSITNIKLREKGSNTPVDVYTKAYDELGQLRTKTDPMSQNESIIYNTLGLITKKTDRMTNNYNYSYDEQNRLISDKVEKQDNSQSMEYKYCYDNPFGAKDARDYVNDLQQGHIAYDYNYLGQVKQKNILGYSNYSSYLSNFYDKAGKLTASGVSKDGNSYFYTNYKYDRDRLNQVQTNGLQTVDNTDTVNAAYEYYPDGKLKKITYPKLADGSYLTSEYTYDKLSRLSNIVNKKGSTILSQYGYVYDDNGNINAVTDSTGNTTYVYDKLDRLTEIHRPDGSVAVYSYDLKGNRKTLQDDSATIDTDNVNYTYDLRNRLTQVTKGTTTTSYSYEPDGLRYKKVTPAKTVQYHYNLAGKVIAESDGTGNVTADYVWGPDKLLVKKDVASGSQYYYVYNGHGDVVQVVDSSGNVVNSYVYDEWGNIASQTEGIENSFKYAGEQYDSETGLYYNRARYYDPQMGRFINEDTYEGQITDPLSFNIYVYCENDPVDNVDPSGHSLISAALKYIAKPAAKFVYTKAVKPAAKFVYNKAVKPTAKYVYNNAIKPTGKYVAEKTKEIAKSWGNKGAGKVGFTTTKDAAQTIGKQLNGTVTELKNGWKIDIPNPSGSSKPVVVRIMNEGSGERTQPYFRVSIDGKGSYTLDGAMSNDRGLTHIDMADSYLEQITKIVNGIGR